MKKIFLPLFKLFRLIFIALRYAANRTIFVINIFLFYLKGDECKKFNDCVLLAKVLKNQPPNSDRYLEYPWVLKNISISSGNFLDVGSTASMMFRDVLPKEVSVYAIDLNDKIILDKSIKFVIGDIRKTGFSDNFFDCVSCISTLEHIGVAGRYNSDDDQDGDLKAMREMKRILKVNGRLLLTVPYGVRDVLPINKLYNKNRLETLLEGYVVVEKVFWKYNKKWGLWFEVEESEAAKTDMLADQWYALCFIKASKSIT